ncbi:MAG TPA: NAD(P)/FAD-dependent oxidoreductase [Mesotoga sp.]|nr:NAD(P)/FAD-dependent oxidoreductase [Thermotogaceae bacterium]HOI64384.1 NAD(P)/FAD-dependent oxidoreductase [Mesotoga sp.]HPM95904.1 NAD(P)/FAD-dependent oxidoreductase [Mesotoga sp.]
MKRIAIVGAGIAGLSAGCYAQMNGFETEIFELHNNPGGLCTSWKRKDYTIDGCIHHLPGASSSSKLYTMWKELGAIEDGRILFDSILRRTIDSGGNELNLYTDLVRLKEHLMEISPADREAIDQYLKAAQKFTKFELLAMVSGGGKDKLSMIPHLPGIMKWGPVSLEQFASRFKNSFLQKAFPTAQYDFQGIPMMIHLSFLAGCSIKSMGWPVGGSLAFSKRIAKRYEELGGKIHYRSRVKSIAVKNDRAVGLTLEDRTKANADIVVSAADGYSTIYDMLNGKYKDDFIDEYYANPPDEQEMNAYVSLGVNLPLNDLPHGVTWLMDEKLELSDRCYQKMDLEVLNSKTEMVPGGKSVVRIPFTASYSYWKKLSCDRELYVDKKHEIATKVIERLGVLIPGIKEKIEVVDVSTPITTERFTGNFHGMQVWTPRSKQGRIMSKGLSKTLPGLDDFYMVGQWAQGLIGIATAAVQGKKLIQRLGKR